MPRFILNSSTRTVHNADCDRAARHPLPWPRFGRQVTKTCAYCLPDGLPFVPRNEKVK